MASVTIPYTFTNGYAADANEVNANFAALKAFVDASLVQLDGSVQATSAAIADGTIVNADVNATAAIAYSKLNLATSIVNADISATAAIALSKLATTGTVTATTFVGALTGTASGNLVSGGALGTPSSGTLTNCTFPTLNQNTTGSAGSVPYSGLTGTVTTWNQNTTGSAASLSIMKSGSLVLTSDAVNTAWFYHGSPSTPSSVIVQNGDFLAYGGVLSIRYWDSSIVSVYASGASFSTFRANWITII